MAGAAPSRSRLLFPDGRRGKGDLERAGQPWPSTASFCRPTAFGRRLSVGALCKGTSLFTRSVGSAPTAAGERGLRTAPVSPHREGVGRARPGPTGVAEPCPLMWGEAADHTPALPSQREKKKGGTTLLGKKRGRPIPLPRGEAVGAGRKGANGRHPSPQREAGRAATPPRRCRGKELDGRWPPGADGTAKTVRGGTSTTGYRGGEKKGVNRLRPLPG